jgi:L-ribulose-5-phosphate 4-epimerase
MLLRELREQVLDANLELVRRGLVMYTFGNVSGISRDEGLVAIKPSGVPYEKLSAVDMVITDLDGKVVDGTLRPSSDLATHLEIYKYFSCAGGVAHTHSEYATAWAQARVPIPCFGTTHADYFDGPVPVTDDMTPAEIASEYERNTGLVICRKFHDIPEGSMNAVLVAGHAPITWGTSASDAAHNAVLLEYVAKLATHTVSIRSQAGPISDDLRSRHYSRKNGSAAYYGQSQTK